MLGLSSALKFISITILIETSDTIYLLHFQQNKFCAQLTTGDKELVTWQLFDCFKR